jgi:hypothetical protein
MVGWHESTGDFGDLCPDCAYSFATAPVGGETTGPYCTTFLTDTLFKGYYYSDFWFGSTAVQGWGWSDSYTYTYGGTDYDLEKAVFLYYDGYADWILRHYNFPAGGTYAVTGDKYSAEWDSYIGEKAYYYYFYY